MITKEDWEAMQKWIYFPNTFKFRDRFEGEELVDYAIECDVAWQKFQEEEIKKAEKILRPLVRAQILNEKYNFMDNFKMPVFEKIFNTENLKGLVESIRKASRRYKYRSPWKSFRTSNKNFCLMDLLGKETLDAIRVVKVKKQRRLSNNKNKRK